MAASPDASPVRVEVLGVHRRRGAARRRARGVLGRARIRGDSGLRTDRDRADRDAQSSVRHQARIGRQGDRRRGDEDRGGRRDSRPRRERHHRLFQRRGRNRPRVRRRLVSYRRHRRARARRPGVHPRTQEGNDRHGRGAQRVSRGRRARAESAARRARFSGGGRWQPAAAKNACTRCWSSIPVSIPMPSSARPTRVLADHQKIRRALDLARTRAAAHRRHAQAETCGDSRLGAERRHADRHERRHRCARGARREIRGARTGRRDRDDRGTRSQLARTRRTDGRARGQVPDAHRRRRVCRSEKRRGASVAGGERRVWRSRARRAGGFSFVEPIAGPPARFAASACRHGSCRWPACSPGRASKDASTSPASMAR